MRKTKNLMTSVGRAATACTLSVILTSTAIAGGLGNSVEQSAGGTVTVLPSYDWEGFFLGATLGGSVFGVEASELNDTFTNDAPPVTDPVAAYGIRAAYNWSPYDDNFLIGAELDATFGLMNEKLVPFNDAETDGLNVENTWNNVISLRARAAVASGRVLTYVAGGPAIADVDYVAEDLDASTDGCAENVCAEVSDTLVGLSFGAGMEYAFRDDWVATFEFIHYAMPSVQAPLLTARGDGSCTDTEAEECTVSFDSSASTVRIGISYRF